MKKAVKTILKTLWKLWYIVVQNRIHIWRYTSRPQRMLEIGPGIQRVEGFESVNIVPGRNVDYVYDCSRKMPFAENTFNVIYASHVLEHIIWYNVQPVLSEWVRILKPQGRLEIFVPDGLKICKAFVDAEEGRTSDFTLDGWYKFNPEKDPCVWANGRIFTYGDGDGNRQSPNWHFTVFSQRYLSKCMQQAGLIDIQQLNNDMVRGDDHGWINLGLAGRKPHTTRK